MVSTYVTKTTKNERAYVKPPRKCCKCKRREIQRNSDKSNSLSKRSLSRLQTLPTQHLEGLCAEAISDSYCCQSW